MSSPGTPITRSPAPSPLKSAGALDQPAVGSTISGSVVIVNGAAPGWKTPSSTRTLNVEPPAAVGVPDSRPLPDSVSPGGSAPATTEYAARGELTNLCEYGVP